MKKPVAIPELGAIHAAEIPYLFDTVLPDPMGSGKIFGDDECEFRHVAKQLGIEDKKGFITAGKDADFPGV